MPTKKVNGRWPEKSSPSVLNSKFSFCRLLTYRWESFPESLEIGNCRYECNGQFPTVLKFCFPLTAKLNNKIFQNKQKPWQALSNFSMIILAKINWKYNCHDGNILHLCCPISHMWPWSFWNTVTVEWNFTFHLILI